MHEKSAIAGRIRQLRIFNLLCLYASFFLHTSITIMATVCRFFPSQSVGKLRPGQEVHLLPFIQSGKQGCQTHSLVGNCACASNVVKSGLPLFNPAYAGQVRSLFALHLQTVSCQETAS